MKHKIIYMILSVFLFISCNISDDSDSNKNFIYQKIPDKYNCGADENISFKKINNDSSINNVYIKIDTRSGKDYVITSYLPAGAPSLPKASVIENYDFSDGNFRILNPDRYDEEKTVTFINCKFKSFKNCGPYDNNKLSFNFEHCSFFGGVNEINISMNWCKIGHFASDAMNPLKNFTAKNCFIYDLMCEGNTNGTHIDGFQIYGRGDTKGGNILIDNVRFEIPSIYYEGNTSAVNACVMYQLEYGDVSNCTFSNLICNGGDRWYPIYLKKTKCKTDGKYYLQGQEFPENNIVLKNVKVSNNFGTIFYPTEHYDKAIIENVEHLDSLYVSSIFLEDGKTHIICSNDTCYDKELVIVTNKKKYIFDMPHCPSNWALLGKTGNKAVPNESLKDKNGREYISYRYEDLPFDVDFVIEELPDYIKCYDGDILIAQCSR